MSAPAFPIPHRWDRVPLSGNKPESPASHRGRAPAAAPRLLAASHRHPHHAARSLQRLNLRLVSARTTARWAVELNSAGLRGSKTYPAPFVLALPSSGCPPVCSVARLRRVRAPLLLSGAPPESDTPPSGRSLREAASPR